MDELKFGKNGAIILNWPYFFKTEFFSSMLLLFKNKPPKLNKPISEQNWFRCKTLVIIQALRGVEKAMISLHEFNALELLNCFFMGLLV